MTLNASSEALAVSFYNLWNGVIGFLPELIVAIVIFIVGWIIGALLGRVVDQVIRAIKLDNALRSAGFETALARGGFALNSGRFLGGLVKWFIIIVFLIASLEVLGLTEVVTFLRDDVLGYLPNVFVAVIIMLAAVVIGDVVKKIVVGSAQAAHVPSSRFVGALAQWAVWIFAVLAALDQLRVAPTFVSTLFTGVIVALSLGFGLAFGLGGQQAAADFTDKLRKEISDRS